MIREKILAINMTNGTTYLNPVITSPRNWKKSDRAFFEIRQGKEIFYICSTDIDIIVTNQGTYKFDYLPEDELA